MTYRSRKWLAVPGYEGIYEVGDAGEVRSLNRLDARGTKRPEKLIKPYRDGNSGYVAVSLVKGGVSKRFKMHRLVSMVWLEESPGKDQVNHINGDKADNSVSNLEWCTGSENVRHSYTVLGKRSVGGHKGKTGAAHHSAKEVIATHIETGAVARFGSTAEAARALSIPSGSIPRCCNGKHRHSHGFLFRYAGGFDE